MEWSEVIDQTRELAKLKGKEYVDRLDYEFKEIEKQTTSEYWLDIIRSGKKYEVNKNGLVLPFLLEITPIDPIKGELCAYIGDENGQLMDGIEIMLEDETKIETSLYSLIKTKKGLIMVKDLKEDDEIIVE